MLFPRGMRGTASHAIALLIRLIDEGATQRRGQREERALLLET